MRKKFIGLVLITLILVIVHQAIAAEKIKDDFGTKLAKMDPKKELIDLRTENRRAFKESNSNLVNFLSTEPLNYLEDDNKFYPIETKLISKSVSETDITTKRLLNESSIGKSPKKVNSKLRHHVLKNSLKVSFADESDGGMVLENKKHQIEFLLKNTNKRKATIKNNRIKYSKVFRNCDLEYTVLPGRVKDELIFYKVPENPVITFKVNTNNLKPQNGPNGSITLQDGSGNGIFTILPSIMFEKDKEEEMKQIETKFHWEKNQLYCDLVLDMGWLKEKKRKYPIVVDPQIQPFQSQGKSDQRFFLYCPETYETVTCQVDIDGPGWHGDLSNHDYARCYFKDATTGETFFSHRDVSDFHGKETKQAIAGHYYEVYIHGGRTRNILGHKYPGLAQAMVTYGDVNGRLFKTLPKKTFNTAINNYILQKTIEITDPQEISYKYVPEFSSENSNSISVSPYFQIYKSGVLKHDIRQSGSGVIKLEIGEYTFVLSPKLRGSTWYHYRAELDFPMGTSNYESRIELRTNLGIIDSTFKLPVRSLFKMQYRTWRNGDPSSQEFPSIKIRSGNLTYFERKFSLGFHDFYDGGDQITLDKEVSYHLIISRGRSGNTGWGGMNINFFHEENTNPTISDLHLIDQNGNRATDLYVGNNHKLAFNYYDDGNTLKQYWLRIQPTGSNEILYSFNNLNRQNGVITIPYEIKDFNFPNDTTLTCSVDVWDGFSRTKMSDDLVFTADTNPPLIEKFTGKVNRDSVSSSITLNCQTRDQEGDLKKRVISWRVNGELKGEKELPAGVLTDTITQLPLNSRVEVSLTAVDRADNKIVKTLRLYTHPETSELIAPKVITGDKATGYQGALKIKKVNASLYRVVRYRGSVSETNKEYDTGYLDPAGLISLKAGPPTVSISEPWNGETVTQHSDITITAFASDVDGFVKKVDFYEGNRIIGTATGSPWKFTWKNVSVGNYIFTAKALDNDGLITVSTPVNISVINKMPSVSIIDGVSANADSVITVNASASDIDGTINRVEFYINDFLLGTDSLSPYKVTFPWNYSLDTTYVLTAKAFDNNGAVTASVPVYITCHKVCQQVPYEVCEPYCWQECWEECDHHIFGHCVDWDTVCETVCTTQCRTEYQTVCRNDFTIQNGTESTEPPPPGPTPPPSNPPDNGFDCYEIMDYPAERHQTYIYKVYTKNGDQESVSEENIVTVANNAPVITNVQPARDGVSYSNGAITIVPQVYDGDEDNLTYYYSITGPENFHWEGVSSTYNFGSVLSPVKDGQYTWEVRVSDDSDTAIATGIVNVDKHIPSAAFTIDGGNWYTTTQEVTISVFETTNDVDGIRVSNDGDNWELYSGANQTINWRLTDGDGKKTIYFQAHNSYGNWGPQVPIQRQITVDTQGPEKETFKVKTEGGTDGVYFSWSGGFDLVSGLASKVNIELYENGIWQRIQSNYSEDSIILPASGSNTPIEIRFQLFDHAGNTTQWVNAVGYTKAASGSINSAESFSGYNLSDGHYIQIKINPIDRVTRYKLVCTNDAGGGDTSVIEGNILEYKDTGLIPHGTYSYKVLTYNSSNQITDTGTEVTFNIINNLPEKPVGMGPIGYITQNNNLGFSFDKDLKNLDPDGDELTVTYYLSTDDTQYIKLDNSIMNGLTDGQTYWWKAQLTDVYGGSVTTDPVSFTLDLTPPVIQVDNVSIAYATEHHIKVVVSDQGSGVKTVSINGEPISGVTKDIYFRNHGTNYLLVEATDEAGHTSHFSHTYYIDQTPPSGGQIKFNLPEKDGTYLAGGNSIPTEWVAADPESGIKQFKYAWSGADQVLDPNKMQSVELLDELGTYHNNFLGNFVDGEIYYLHLIPENYLGLTGSVMKSPPLLYDHIGPEMTLKNISGGNRFNGFYYLSGLEQLEIEVNTSDPHTGIIGIEYALMEEKNQQNIQWFETLSELESAVELIDGKVYYIAIKATNGTYLTNTIYSEPIIVDSSAPLINVTGLEEQNDNRIYLAQVNLNDPETMVTKLEYAIGIQAGGNDLSKGLPGADSNGWITIDYPTNNFELRQYGNIQIGSSYYYTVKATNVAGQISTATTNGTVIVMKNAPVVWDDGNFTSERSTLHFEWSFPNCTEPVETYEYQIYSDQEVIKAWTECNSPNSVIVTGLKLIDNTCYYCDVRAKYENGVSEIGTSDGILVDLSPPQIEKIIYPTYAGISGISLAWSASDPESGVKCYAGLGTAPGETTLTNGRLALGNLTNFKLSQDTTGKTIEFKHKQRYYVTLLVENGAGLTVQQTSTAITMDLTPPETPVVIDEGNYTNRDDQLKFNWKWPLGDEESGILEYWYTLTTQRAISGGEQWYTSLQAKEVLMDELELIQGGTYYLAVKAINNAGMESIGFSDGILIDTTAPTPPTVVDHGDFSLINTSLSISMIASDAESGIAGYKLSLGTAENKDCIIKDQNVLSQGGTENLTINNLTLEEGEIYYFTITAINQAGLDSMTSMSDGIMIDTKIPEVEQVNVQGRYLTDTTKLSFDWLSKPCPSGIIDAQYAISENPNGSGLTWQSADLSGSQTVTGLNLSDGKTYYVYVRFQNRSLAENTPGTWSTPGRSNSFAIDLTPPEIINVNTPSFAGNNFLLQWEARDNVSGIVEYRYAVGSYRGGSDVTDGWVSLVSDKTTISFIRNDLPLHNSHLYYISVMAKNAAGLWSEAYKSDGIVTELSPSVISKLTYPSSYHNSRTSIKGIYWEAQDPESGISAYRIEPVIIKDGKELKAPAVPTNETQGSIDLNQLNLEEGQVYYLAMQVLNGAGDWSEVCYTQGIIIDTLPPELVIPEAPIEFVTNSGELDILWKSNEPGIVTVKLVSPNGQEQVETVDMLKDNVYSFRQTMEGVYTLSLSPKDLANNPGLSLSQKIRLNAKPFANPGTERRVFKGGTVAFEPEVSDSDGTVVEFLWDFGNGETSAEAKPSCSYRTLGEYTVALKVMDNDGKWSEPGITHVTVTNTASGDLTMDEDWEGEATISGDIKVPQGITLRIKPGTKMDFTGKFKVIVNGRIIIEGTAENPVIIGANTTTWDGIRLINADSGSIIRYAEIHLATTGVVVSESDLTIDNCLFKGNRIGLHILKSAPIVKKCTFEANLIYGVKEDDNATPMVIDCQFVNNQVTDYYEDKLGIINMETLNGLGKNDGNTKSE